MVTEAARTCWALPPTFKGIRSSLFLGSTTGLPRLPCTVACTRSISIGPGMAG